MSPIMAWVTTREDSPKELGLRQYSSIGRRRDTAVPPNRLMSKLPSDFKYMAVLVAKPSLVRMRLSVSDTIHHDRGLVLHNGFNFYTCHELWLQTTSWHVSAASFFNCCTSSEYCGSQVADHKLTASR